MTQRIDKLEARSRLPRHRHREGYVAIILSGNYEEAGDEGRWQVGPGQALYHAHWDAHADQIGRFGAQVLNLPLPPGLPLPAAFSLHDADAVVRAAERDVAEAIALLSPCGPGPSAGNDWPDALALALRDGDAGSLTLWAAANRMAPETVSRGFRMAFGTSPTRYRTDARAKRAWKAICAGSASLADTAHDHGYADQPHMTRDIARLTGAPPGAWRSNAFKTGSRLAP